MKAVQTSPTNAVLDWSYHVRAMLDLKGAFVLSIWNIGKFCFPILYLNLFWLVLSTFIFIKLRDETNKMCLNCPVSFERYNGYNSSCFSKSRAGQNYYASQSICEQKNSTLIIVDSDAKFNFLDDIWSETQSYFYYSVTLKLIKIFF